MDHCYYFQGFINGGFIILLLYVDDMLVASTSKEDIMTLKAQLAREFYMKDLEHANLIFRMTVL